MALDLLWGQLKDVSLCSILKKVGKPIILLLNATEMQIIISMQLMQFRFIQVTAHLVRPDLMVTLIFGTKKSDNVLNLLFNSDRPFQLHVLIEMEIYTHMDLAMTGQRFVFSFFRDMSTIMLMIKIQL